MPQVFSRTNFPPSPGSNHYQWEEAKTRSPVSQQGNYVIKIITTAKNAQQNNSTDNDDLRIILDGYEFGKDETHKEKVSWRGFGTTAAWDGASLKGGIKTLYFFIKLDKFNIDFTLTDTYDFDYKRYQLFEYYKELGREKTIKDIFKEYFFTYLNNLADKGEFYDVVKNFEIRINLKDTIKLKE